MKAGDVLVLICRGPMGTGMEEIYQITAALKHLSFGKHIAVLTDARFSGVSTGACVGHVAPEALAGGPIGKLVEGDRVRIVVDRNRLEGSIDLVGHGDRDVGSGRGRARARRAVAPARPRGRIPIFRRTPGSGRRCRRSAAARGVAACYDVDAIERGAPARPPLLTDARRSDGEPAAGTSRRSWTRASRTLTFARAH